MKSNKLKAVAYYRCTDGKSESIEKQKYFVKEFAARNNIEIIESFETDKRGYATKELEFALDYCANNPQIEYLLVSNRSRICRDSRCYQQWQYEFADVAVEIKVACEGDEKNPVEHFMENMFQMVGRLDNQMWGESIKSKMLNKAKEGYLMHRPPLGYSPTGKSGLYEPNTMSHIIQSLLEAVIEKRVSPESCISSARMILEYKNDRDYKPSEIRKLLLNPYYAGLVSFKGELYPGKHTGLISTDDWCKLKELFEADGKKVAQA